MRPPASGSTRSRRDASNRDLLEGWRGEARYWKSGTQLTKAYDPTWRGGPSLHCTIPTEGELTDVTAKVVIYEAFVKGKLEAPKHLARTVHDLYFEPKYEEFRPRTIWSLSNAFTSAFKALDPIPQFRATAKLGEFLDARFSQSF